MSIDANQNEAAKGQTQNPLFNSTEIARQLRKASVCVAIKLHLGVSIINRHHSPKRGDCNKEDTQFRDWNEEEEDRQRDTMR